MNNVGSKYSLLMKFGQFMSYYKKKSSSKNYTKIAAWKLEPEFFVFARNYAQLLLENDIFEASYLY